MSKLSAFFTLSLLFLAPIAHAQGIEITPEDAAEIKAGNIETTKSSLIAAGIKLDDLEMIQELSKEIVRIILKYENVTPGNINKLVQDIASSLAQAVAELSIDRKLNMVETRDAIDATAQGIVTAAVEIAKDIDANAFAVISASAQGAIKGAASAAIANGIDTATAVSAAVEGSITAALEVTTNIDLQFLLPIVTEPEDPTEVNSAAVNNPS